MSNISTWIHANVNTFVVIAKQLRTPPFPISVEARNVHHVDKMTTIVNVCYIIIYRVLTNNKLNMTPETNYTYDAIAEQLAKTSPTLQFQDGYDVAVLTAAVETAGKIPGSEIHFVVPRGC